MAKKRKDNKPGYGKLLDAWDAPDDAGDPVGCLATSFTFSPVFFEEECLARFLVLETEPTEDGPAYLVEREEKLAQLGCAAVLVDQHHCRGGRSLRWDMIAARIPRGLLHAKISLLYWSNLVRLIISSANLTEDGYRRNLEVFGVLDYRADGEAPLSSLSATIEFLRRAAQSGSSADELSPPIRRWNKLLDRVAEASSDWGVSDEKSRRSGVQVSPLFTGPEYPTVFKGLADLWPARSAPYCAKVVSPFFDRPEVENQPAEELWGLLRQRGEAWVEFFVTGDEIPGEEGIFLNAPESLSMAEPQGRANVSTAFYRIALPEGRQLHAKGIWLENARWIAYQIGSSNFTSAGTGLSNRPNFEANLVYIVDFHRAADVANLFQATIPKSEPVDLDSGVQWRPLSGEGEDEVGEEILLPPSFVDAVFNCDQHQRATIEFSFDGKPPAGWELITDGDDQRFWGAPEWVELNAPESCVVDWKHDRPPSGFWVRWSGSEGTAWWPVNVAAGEVLPPPEELKHLPLEVLINILSSARPLHRVLQDYLRRRQKQDGKSDGGPVMDPHSRVDTRQFLLQRTRRISWALNALRNRLERPVATIEFLRWRLRGPVGVMALAEALVREARSEEEKAFLISELALELSRVKPEAKPGCVPPEEHVNEVREVIRELHQLIPELDQEGPDNLKRYVQSVFEAVSA